MNVWPYLPMGGSTEPPVGVNLIYGECGTWLTIPVTATPGDGWEFVEWTGACSGTSPSTEVQCGPLSANRSCTAVILPLPPEILELRGPDEPVYVGDTVDFTARAEAPEKISCLDFQWDFADGQSGASTECFEPHEGTVSHAYDSDGEYTVEVTICVSVGGYGNVCNSDSITVTVLGENQPPVVEAGGDQKVFVGDPVEFKGSASDPDGTIESIDWTFGDGGSASGSVSTSHSYSGPGEYTVTLTVCDDDGACSKDTLKITVLSAAGEADLAILKWAPVEPVVRGERIEYGISVANLGPDDAHGITVTDELPPGLTYESDNCGGSVTDLTWFWEPGALGREASAECELTVIVNDDAPETITNTAAVFSATRDRDPDNNGASATVQVRPQSLSLKWRYPKTAWMGRNYQISLWVENRGPSEQELSIRLQEVPVSDETIMHFEGEAYSAGSMITTRVPPGWEGEFVFTVNNSWEWIPEWEPARFTDILKEFALAVPHIEDVSGLLDASEVVVTFLNAHPRKTYAYRAEADSPSATFAPVHLAVDVSVPPSKALLLGLSMYFSVGSGEMTTAGFVALLSVAGAEAAPALFLGEVGSMLGASIIYRLAADPTPDFTQLAEAEPVPMPNHCLPDDERVRDIAEDYSVFLGLLQALSDSYIRWEAAEDAGSEEWMALHLDRIERYANEAADIIDGLVPVTEELVSGIPIPTESQILDIRQMMADTGLPEIEVCLLEGLGYAPEEIDAIEQAFLLFPDEYFVSFGELPDMMAVLAAALRELPESVARVLPVGALTLGLSAGWNHACYAGSTQPIEQALAGIIDEVLAVYRLTPGHGFERWFPGRPEVSTMTHVNPYDALLVLMAGDITWAQEDAETPPESVDLVEGWNSICYAGQTKSADDATSGMAGGFGILYRLGDGQGWSRYVPGRPEVSNVAQLNQYDAVLMLVTDPSGIPWVFDP